MPLFAFEYGDTGAGNDVGIAHNWAAFDAIKITPRYGVMSRRRRSTSNCSARRYAAPIGIAPMGGPSLVWPGADLFMAKAAQRARVPYTLGVAGGATIEQAAEAAPDVFWLQLYRFWHDDHKIGFDLMRARGAVERQGARAHARRAGAHHALARNLCRARPANSAQRAHDLRNAGAAEMAVGADAQRLSALCHHPPIRRRAPSTNEIIAFARANMGGAFSWEEVKRYRDQWKGKMAVKGVLHPADAEKAVALGIDGIWVSNHGGRQIEALSPSIDCLPAIVAAVGKKATVLLDSGVRSGQDVMRALALGADAAFAGKSFLWAVAALGDEGPAQLIDLYIDELRASLGQIGAHSPAEAREATIHPGASIPGAWRSRSRATDIRSLAKRNLIWRSLARSDGCQRCPAPRR